MSRLSTVLLITLPCLAAALSAQSATPTAVPRAINAILGDESFAHAFGDASAAAGADENLRITTHLLYVEGLLRQADVGGYPDELRRARRANIERLRAYRENGVFPRNFDHANERRPCFIDHDGRLCAVGHLVAETAGRELAEAINERFQYSLLADMHDARLAAWAGSSGLTARELAMIQPAYGSSAATATYYGDSCAPEVMVAPYVVTDPVAWYGLYGWFGGSLPSWWVTAPAGARWIGSACRVAHGVPYTLSQTFDLTGFDPSTATVTGEWTANPGTEIVLNGVPTGIVVPSSGWTAAMPFTLTSGFVPGVNVLGFRVTPTEEFFGLLVTSLAGTVEHVSPQPPVAIPGLFATGVDAQGAQLAGGELDPHYRTDEPPLRAKGRPVVPNPDLGFTVHSEPNRLVLLALSHGSASLAIGHGCTQWIDTNGMVAVLGFTDSAGIAEFATPMPPLSWTWSPPAFYLQAVIADPASPLAGLTLTQGVRLRAGN